MPHAFFYKRVLKSDLFALCVAEQREARFCVLSVIPQPP